MQAYAYVVGPQDGPGAALHDLAGGLALAGVASFTTLAQVEQQMQVTPVCFFLFAAVNDVGRLRGVAEAVRYSSSRKIRFSPMVYFAESPSGEAIQSCLNMGFDDIITMPFTPRRVAERLARQVERNLAYFETATYFGPDRRERTGSGQVENDIRKGGAYRRLEIIRSTKRGTSVLRDDHYAALAQ